MPTLTDAEVLGVRIRRRTRRDAIGALCALLADGWSHSVYFFHAATANLAFEDPAFRAVLNRGHLVLNDGIGVRWAARVQGVTLEENLVGTDLIPDLLGHNFERPLRIFLLGGQPGVIERAAAHICDRFPQVEVAGFHHGYFAAGDEAAIVERIRCLAPDLVLVGMGNPRQEYFIDRHLPHLGCRLAIGVGGLFDHFAGELRRAPGWMQCLGLEWSQLLVQQPHKWRRYLVGGPRFLWRVFGGAGRAWLRGAAVVSLSLAFALAAAEGTVRLVRPQILERYPAGLYIASATRQYKLRPHFRGLFRYPEFQTEVRINGQGLRADRDYRPSHAGVRRILAIGDSFTMGYSVDEPLTWVRVLEAELRGQGSVDVINAGVPGYSTWQELAYLEEDGQALAPDVVLLGFFVGNDISDNASPRLPVEFRDGSLISAGAGHGLLPLDFRLSLARHSHLYKFVHRTPSGGGARYNIYGGSAQAGWTATAALLERFRAFCAGRAIRPVVVLMPERIQVEAELRSAVGAAIDPVAPNRRLRAICRRAGLETIDLLDSLVGPGLYFAQDGHWTARGNALAARAIADHLSHDPH